MTYSETLPEITKRLRDSANAAYSARDDASTTLRFDDQWLDHLDTEARAAYEAGKASAYDHAAQLVEHFIEAFGKASGGLDGVLVTFGDGADADTWGNVFGHIAAKGYTLKVTTVDGRQLDVASRGHTADRDGRICLRYRAFSTQYEEAVGPELLIPIETIAAIHVY